MEVQREDRGGGIKRLTAAVLCLFLPLSEHIAGCFWGRVFGFFTHVIFSPLFKEPKTDIGLPHGKLLKERKERKKILKQNHQNAEMERAARLRTGLCPAAPRPSFSLSQQLLQRFSLSAVLIPLDEVRAEWEKTSGPFHRQRLAEYYGIFRDLFQKGTFTPWVSLRVEYSQEDEHLVPVYYGNMVTPTEVCEGCGNNPGPVGSLFLSVRCF